MQQIVKHFKETLNINITIIVLPKTMSLSKKINEKEMNDLGWFRHD
jgi:hypothetical protein